MDSLDILVEKTAEAVRDVDSLTSFDASALKERAREFYTKLGDIYLEKRYRYDLALFSYELGGNQKKFKEVIAKNFREKWVTTEWLNDLYKGNSNPNPKTKEVMAKVLTSLDDYIEEYQEKKINNETVSAHIHLAKAVLIEIGVADKYDIRIKKTGSPLKERIEERVIDYCYRIAKDYAEKKLWRGIFSAKDETGRFFSLDFAVQLTDWVKDYRFPLNERLIKKYPNKFSLFKQIISRARALSDEIDSSICTPAHFRLAYSDAIYKLEKFGIK